MKRSTQKEEKGFSLLELVIALGVFLIVIAFVISAFTNGLKTLRRERNLAGRDTEIRRALDLMTSELSQAGVTPDIIDYPTSITSNLPEGSKLASATSGTNGNVSLTNTNTASILRGLYPGRQLTIGLPETTGDDVTINSLPTSACSPCAITVTPNPTARVANTYISSPALPNMFGIMNPPPVLTTGNGLPMTTAIKPASGSPLTRIGFIGDIIGDGNLYYVEYAIVTAAPTVVGLNGTGLGRLVRSITPINGSTTKGTNEVLLNNVVINTSGFTLVYPNTSTPIPIAVRISLTVRTLERAIQRYQEKDITLNVEVMPRGTAAAAQLWARGYETSLRKMMPDCRTTGPDYTPCSGWSTAQWWNNVSGNFASGLP